MIESTAVSMTAYLLNELMKRKIKVIFCDEKRQPAGELIPYYGSHDSSRRIREQICFDEYLMDDVWAEVVKEKIRNQAALLASAGQLERSEQLQKFALQVQPGDLSNREGHAAKVYFNGLFGLEFSRREDNSINAALNYGYAVLLGAVNREIAANGYLTQLGISHSNVFNSFNLGCDLMEPLRVLIDHTVLKNKFDKFGPDEKYILLHVFDSLVEIAGRKEKMRNALGIYIRSIFESLRTNSITEIRFCKLDLTLND